MLHNMKLPGFFYQRFHAFYLFSAQQREQLRGEKIKGMKTRIEEAR